MRGYDTNHNKDDGTARKPATVLTADGREIDANHHIINDTARVCHLYLGARSDGIDVSIPLERVTAIVRSARGATALGIDTVVEVGDVVTVRDEDRASDPGPWKVKGINGDGEAELWSSAQPMRCEPVGDLTVVEKAKETTLPHAVPGGDDDDDGRGRVMTDGGRDPICTGRTSEVEIYSGDDIVNVYGDLIGTVERFKEETESVDRYDSALGEQTHTRVRPRAVVIDPDGDEEYTRFAGSSGGIELTKKRVANEIPPGAIDRCQCGGLYLRFGTLVDGPGPAKCSRDHSDETGESDESREGQTELAAFDDDNEGKTLMTDGGEPLDDDDVDTDTDFSGVDIAPGGGDAAELPPGYGDDDTGDEVDMSALSPGVDIDSVTTPNPIVKTIAARSLSHAVYYKARYELPSRDDKTEAGEEQCDCETNVEGYPYWQTTARVEETIDAIDTTAAEEVEDGDAPRVSLYGRVTHRFEDTDDWDPSLSVRLADKTGIVDVDLHPSMSPLEAFTPGDEVLVTDVERTDEGDAAFTVTKDSAVVNIAESAEDDGGYYLHEQSELVHAETKFEEMETVTAARSWMADVIVRENHIETPRGSDAMWMYVDDADSDDYGLFVKNGESRLEELIDEYIPAEWSNNTTVSEIISVVQRRTYVEEDAFRGGEPDHESRRWSVAVQNGVIDLRTGELHDHDPAWRCTAKLPVAYDPDVTELGEEWDWFLGDISKAESDREVLMYAVGHALCRCYPVEAIFTLIGPGKNGKTVFHKAVKELLQPVAGDFEFKALTGDSEFGTGSLKGNHMVVDDDATDVKAHDLSTMKRHSGGASAEVNVKHEKRESYNNYATMMLLSNDPPVFADKSDGAKRRMFPANLPHRFTDDPGDDNKDAIPEEELLSRLTSDDELEALLAVAVQYAQDMYRTGEIDDGRTEDERWDLYESYSDSILRFWDELTVQETGARVPRSVIYEIYVQWCDVQGIDAVAAGGRNGFWPLSDQCHAVSYKRQDIYADGERAVEHVMITEDALDYAPRWVRDEWEADVAEDKSTLANRLDRVTPIADLNKGYSTTSGTVIAREIIDNGESMAVCVTIEDTTHAIDVYEWVNDSVEDAALDGVTVGDELHLKRAVLTSNKGVPQLKLKRATEVTVSESGVFESVDETGVTDDDDGDDAAVRAVPDEAVEAVAADGGGEVDQEPRVQSVRDAITELAGEDGDADIDDVVELARCDAGIDAPTARQALDSLKRKGAAYEPSDGEIRLTGGGD